MNITFEREELRSMGFDAATRLRLTLARHCERASDQLASVPGVGSGAFGLTLDSVKATSDYIKAKQNYDTAFNALRNFNAVYTRVFKQEYAAARESRRVQE